MAARVPNADSEIMVFRPTMEEFKDFNRYILYMESQGAHRGGVAKIIPPKEWKPSKSYDHIDNLIIPAPISQVVQGQKGLYTQWNIQKKATTVKEFRRLANTERYAAPFHENYEDLERKYWKNITFNPPIYGADISGSLYDENVKEWNIAKLNSILDLVENESGVKIEGVNTAYLYFGMWKSSFAWHTEDMDLYSINYIHFGAPKSWYSVPPEHGKRLERLAKGFFPSSYNQCQAFLRHKMTVISPSVLRQYGIPYNKITHEAGEFMITFPYGYHSGFNHGYNCAESTNFASPRWITYGCDAVKCRCRNDMVFINMDVFMRVFKPDEYEDWKKNRVEIKPSYTAVPDPPDFKKPAVHWRVQAQAIQDLHHQTLQMKKKKKSKSSTSEDETLKRTKDIKKVSVKLSPIKLNATKTQAKVKSPTRKTLHSPTSSKPSPSRSCSSLSYGQTLQLSSQTVKLTSEQDKLIKDVVKKTKPKKTSVKSTENSSPRKPMVKADPFANLKALSQPKKELNHAPNDEELATPLPNENEADDDVFTTEKDGVTLFDRIKMKNRKASAKKANGKRNSESFMKEFKKTIKRNKKAIVKTDDMNDDGSNLNKIDDFSDSDSVSDEEYTNDEQEAPSYLKYLKNESGNKNRKFSNTPSPRPPLKRRHPVSRKGPSKKAGPTVVLKETDDSSGSELEAKATKKSKTKKSSKYVKPTEGYPALWLQRKSSFKSERQYNTIVAKLPPYCAICTLFQPYYQQTHSSDAHPTPLSTLLERTPNLICGQSSKPIIPEQNFATSTQEAAPLATCEFLDSKGESVLVQCESCALQVHASCYGVRKSTAAGEKWCCDRCSFKAWVAQCCLCCLKGGALKPVNDGVKWAHVTCAVAIPEISFDDVPGRNGINISNISSIRQKLKCVYCKRMNQSSQGFCIQCCAGRCATSFHVTCATSAGIHMELADWPFPVSVYCKRHAAIREKRKQSKKDSLEDLPDIDDGQIIIGKHRNRRYYRCKVLSQNSQMFHHVEFDDKSWSNNVLTEDFVGYDYAKHGLPAIGSAIKLQWTDNKIYNTEYQGCKKKHMLTVEFENGDILTIKRSDCYVATKEMPKHLLRKLSSATERKAVESNISRKPNSSIMQKSTL